MTTSQNTNMGLSCNLKETLEEHLESIKKKIADRALDIASSKTPGESAKSVEKPKVSISDLAQAIDEMTHAYPVQKEQKMQFFDLFPPFTCICAILCLAFAVLGLLPLLITDEKLVIKATTQTSGFLDIAKIFAGAIVGSTTSIALRAARAKGGR